MTTSTLFATADTQVFHQFGRLHSMNQWWQWFALAAIAVAVVVYVALMYRKDCVELPRGLACGLFLLRCVAFGGVLFYFLDLEKREERRLVRSSRAVVLVDTSLSMGIQDMGTSGNRRRIDEVIEEFAQRNLLSTMRDSHDLVVYRFDQQTNPTEVVSLPHTSTTDKAVDVNARQTTAEAVSEARTIAAVAATLLTIGLLSFLTYWVRGRRRRTPARQSGDGASPDRAEQDGSWTLLVSMVAAIAGVVVLCVASLRHPELELVTIVGARQPRLTRTPANTTRENNADQTTAKPDIPPIAWNDSLAPRGAETRLGDALRFVINKERGGPIAGIIVLSDGGSNAGSDYQESVVAARAAGIPIYCVGLGSDRRPMDVRVVDLEAPPRVYPGDAFQMTGYLQSFGFASRSVKIELVSKAAKDSNAEPTVEDVQQATLAPDGELVPIKFEITPMQAGLRTYSFRAAPPSQDTDDRNNEKAATVQVVERKNRVLLFAGSATREFQFLRNMLFRDKNTTLHVLLQSGVPGISQEATELLFDFPKLAEELFEYDCIVVFDADWTALDELQTQLLERWVAEKAGGLVLIAGRVETPKLVGGRGANEKLETIRGLYPVVFYDRGSATLSLSRKDADTPWPLSFTREGREADFLRLEDDPLQSEQAWSSYPGVYEHFAVKDPKPGAKIYAEFSDPTTAIDGDFPVYMASHFYGAGRVFYQGSGEMWRLRQVSDAYFERYYTKLIRWASQGRLLRDSSRGLLLVDKDRCLLGETIAVQAVLTDSQHEPLTVGDVLAILVLPDGRRSNLPLRRVEDAARPGTYAAQFSTILEGDYRLELPVPGGSEEELLTREVRARIPAMETERPERNDALLKDLAQKTGGAYYVGLNAAMNRGAGLTPLPTLVEPQEQVTFLPGTPDKTFDLLLMKWLLGIICGALCLEWLVRRLVKLA